MASSEIDFEYLGLNDDPVRLIDYQQAWDYQRELHEQISAEQIPGRVLLLEHEAVYTAGRQTLPEERPFDGTPVIDVDRGGKITWHGPGQLVGYPIVKLPSRVGVVDHVRRMEQAIIDLLAELGIQSTRVEGRTGVWLPAVDSRPVTTTAASLWDADPRARSAQSAGAAQPARSGQVAGTAAETPAEASAAPSRSASTAASGVQGSPGSGAPSGSTPFVSPLESVLAVPARPERKICAIGIRVARRTTMHGFAVNVTGSTAAFENIIPCGISDAGVTSIAAELGGPAPSVVEIARMLEPHLARCLDYSRPLADVLA